MLKQSVSIDDVDCSNARSRALAALPVRNGVWSVDPALRARLAQAATTFGIPSLDVVPGAATLLMPLALPLNTARKRRNAVQFAMEPYLATGLDSTHVCVGPRLDETTWLCAAIDTVALHKWAPTPDGSAAILPDLCAVPRPRDRAAWSVWNGQGAVYLRTSDGGGLVVARDAFADLWRAFDQPAIELCHGPVPIGVRVAHHSTELPAIEADLFDLDLRVPSQTSRASFGRRARFAAVLFGAVVMVHAALLYADGIALERLAQTRTDSLTASLADRGIPTNLTLPASSVTDILMRQASQGLRFDPFLTLLGRVSHALPKGTDMAFRDLRYDATAGTLTVLLTAADLNALQNAENALRNGGMIVSGGAATRATAGAEMQLVISGGV